MGKRLSGIGEGWKIEGQPTKELLTYPEERRADHTRLMLHVVRRAVTVQGAAERYLQEMRLRECSPDYIRNVRLALRAFTRKYGSVPVCELTEVMVRRVLRAQFNRVQPQTYAHYSTVYRLFFEFCREKHYTLYNYVREFVYLYRPGVAFFTSYQLDILFAKLAPLSELRDACLTLYDTGISAKELNQIERVSYASGTLVLRIRTVNASPIVLLANERRRFYDLKRVKRDFVLLMRELDFKGTLRYFPNTYLLRAYWAGTPLEVIAWQMGLASTKSVQRRLKRVLSAGAGAYRFRQEHPYQDYW